MNVSQYLLYLPSYHLEAISLRPHFDLVALVSDLTSFSMTTLVREAIVCTKLEAAILCKQPDSPFFVRHGSSSPIYKNIDAWVKKWSSGAFRNITNIPAPTDGHKYMCTSAGSIYDVVTDEYVILKDGGFCLYEGINMDNYIVDGTPDHIRRQFFMCDDFTVVREESLSMLTPEEKKALVDNGIMSDAFPALTVSLTKDFHP